MLRQLSVYGIALTFFCVSNGGAKELTRTEVEKALHRGRCEAQGIVLPDNISAEEGRKAARASAALYHSPAFQQKIARETQRLQQEVFAEQMAPLKKRELAVQKAATLEGEEGRLYLFLSSSLPLELVRTWITAVQRLHSPALLFVMKGIPGGMAAVRHRDDPHRSWFGEVLQKDAECRGKKTACDHDVVTIAMRPQLFTRFGVEQVPAVVYTTEAVSYRISGDAGLDGLLEQINRTAKSPQLSGIIKRLRGSQ